MQSIRDYRQEIRVCADCGQPAYYETEVGAAYHFAEQSGGVFCPRFPRAGNVMAMRWDDKSLADVRTTYPDSRTRTTAPTASVAAGPGA